MRGAAVAGPGCGSEAWYQDQGAQFGSDRRQQVEHESLAMLLAEQQRCLGACARDGRDDVARRRGARHRTVRSHLGRRVASTTSTTSSLDAVWKQLGKLHEAGISHGSIDAIHFWFDSAGDLQLMGFADAVINPTGDQMQQDVAAMLVMTTMGVGADRAIAAARRAKGDHGRRGDAPAAPDRSAQRAAASPRQEAEAEDQGSAQADGGRARRRGSRADAADPGHVEERR